MTVLVPPAIFTVVIAVALGLTTLAPLLLVVLLVRDWKSGKLW